MDTQDRAAPLKVPKEDEITSITALTQPLDSFGKIVFVIILVEIVLMIGLNFYQQARINSYDKQIADKQAQLNSGEFRALNDQVGQIISGTQKLSVVLNNKQDWGKFYAQLNAVTPKNVHLSSITVAESGTFKAEGETASLSSLAQALVAWRDGTSTTKTPFTSVALSNNGFVTDGNNRRVTFSVSGQVDLGALR